ncbi:MAG TPA: NAD(P)-binding domain-containing protein [Oligoflexus sp.]|uniref:NADPH-dependent F420 reductase n=1 Tax=Oligoflexus sp. TaxID=1971216 RepID=UPI002D31AC2C|nr:NAD(P)-binding domain-containing protein [Oligoflexus sp.]HYX36504.1 NAD(P)-binding domain-containing protein [Oligoflexus sp.]
MKIGIIGVGHIGKTLARKLSGTGHQVKVANSRGPETIEADVLATGAQAVTTAEALKNVEVIILSIPLHRIPEIAPLMADLPRETVVIDTSNYYPGRDGRIEAIEAGQIESLWVVDQLQRPVVKAWNSIGSDSFARFGTAPGSPDRIALPVAADREKDRKVGMKLVVDTGFDAYDAGPLAESWRQQPGAPAYCTDLSLGQLPLELAKAEQTRLPTRRDLAVAVMMERMGDSKTNPSADFGVRLSRTIYM